jgi:hypothetical protein
VHMLIEAGAKAVDEGDCADVQCCVVCIGRTRAVDLQRLCNESISHASRASRRYPLDQLA